MNTRLMQFLGLMFLIISIAMTLLVYQSTLQVGGGLSTMLAAGLVAWGILALPELAIGLWLLVKGTRAAKIGDISDDLIRLVQREGRIGVE
ncbi:MAG: hypothetical protein ACTSYX_05985, partial [Candidatus Thorarchaeota archaeon]